MNYELTTIKQVRTQFWVEHPELTEVKGQRQNNYNTDTSCIFVDWVDYIRKNGRISEALAHNVTL